MDCRPGLRIGLTTFAVLTALAGGRLAQAEEPERPCSYVNEMVLYPGPSIVIVNAETGERIPPDDGKKGQPTGIEFKVPLDCDGNVLRPETLGELTRFIGDGLSLEDMLAMGASEGVVRWYLAGDDWDLKKRIAFDRFVYSKFRLGHGSIAERFRCASGGEGDMSAIELVAIRERLLYLRDPEGEEYLAHPTRDGPNPNKLFNYAWKIVWLCDGSPES